MAYYSFEFAANITRLCMEEIQRRGLQERKIFVKSVPNNGLFIKVFHKRTCSREDLSCVSVHSVATLMLDALWSTPDRIISKKAWRTINYETCTLSTLSAVLTRQSEELLISILDFLLEILQHKRTNLMTAYKLGDALGKVVLGPSDCSPIISEKAGHFLTRLIIEYAKLQQHNKALYAKKEIHRIDSGIDYDSYKEYKPLCKSEGTQARAKYYNRVISKTKHASSDWCENVTGVQTMLDDEYEDIPEPPEKTWLSIFTPAELLLNANNDAKASPTLYRILRESIRPVSAASSDPFESSYLFSRSKAYQVERQLKDSFSEFDPQQFDSFNLDLLRENKRSHHLTTAPIKKLNHSLSNMKLNIKKYRSRQDLHLLEESVISEATVVDDLLDSKKPRDSNHKTRAMKHMMKKVMKMALDNNNKESTTK